MATYNLDQTAFTNTLTNFDAATRSEILQYLNQQGIYTTAGATAVVQYQPTPPGGPSVPPIDPNAQISEFTPTQWTADTDSNTHITAVIATSPSVNAAITGGHARYYGANATSITAHRGPYPRHAPQSI